MKTASDILTGLQFKTVTPANFADIHRFMHMSDSLTCDYTFGGVVLWAQHFNYRVAIENNTLFLSGGREDDRRIRSFALPVGSAGFDDALELLRGSCGCGELWFSAVPEDRLHLFAGSEGAEVSELGREWSDYLYLIEPLATLAGGDMKRKRNHVNRFIADHPDARLVDFGPAAIAGSLDLLSLIGFDATATGQSEFRAVTEMLARWPLYAPYFTAMALVVDGEVAGFTVGEVKGETLHAHVEKCNHSISGANEALTSMFAAEMWRRHPQLRFVNRQDDAGSAGLRASKESWRPLRLLPKFNVRLPSNNKAN